METALCSKEQLARSLMTPRTREGDRDERDKIDSRSKIFKQMNGFQRIKATLENRTPDRLAAMPITMMLAADVIDVPYGDYVSDYRVLVEGQLATASRFGFDYVSVISDPAREAHDHGARVRFFDDAPPAIDESDALLADKSRLEALPVLDPLKEGSRSLDRVNGVRGLASAMKNERIVEGWIEGPCAEGADLRGINQLMLDFLDDPEFVHRLFDFNVRSGLRFAEAQLRAGADLIGIGDAAASLVGPVIYREFVFPYEKRLVEEIHALGGGVRLHICGNISRSLHDVGRLDCDIVDLDFMVPMNQAREEMPPGQILAGNIDPVQVLRNGSPETVFEAVAQCHRKAGTGFIVAAGCEIPRDTPEDNIHAMIHYAETATL